MRRTPASSASPLRFEQRGDPFFVFFTLVTGPRRSLSLNLSHTRVYAPQIRARLGTTAHFCEVARTTNVLVVGQMHKADGEVSTLCKKAGFKPETVLHTQTHTLSLSLTHTLTHTHTHTLSLTHTHRWADAQGGRRGVDAVQKSRVQARDRPQHRWRRPARQTPGTISVCV